jgi:hypothetical protein
MVARDWRGGKVFYREWSKSGVERTLGALNGEGSSEELAAKYWRTSRLSPISPDFPVRGYRTCYSGYLAVSDVLRILRGRPRHHRHRRELFQEVSVDRFGQCFPGRG